MKILYLIFIGFSQILFVIGKPKGVVTVSNGGKLTVGENEQLQNTCGHYSGPITKSFGSNPSKRSEAPWVVGIALVDEDGSITQTEEICSASLISNRHVLTASHCLILPIFDKFRFVFDDDCSASLTETNCSIDNAIIRKAVKAVTPNINLNEVTPGTMDLAIVELDEPVTFRQDLYPVCLSETHPKIKDILDLYSFGSDERKMGETLAGSLQHIRLTNLPCYKYEGIDTMCVRSDGQASRDGDSGGGYVYKKDNITYVTGIVSGSEKITKTVSEDREVSIAHHLQWICTHTGICVDDGKTEQIHTLIDTITPYE